MSIPLPTDRDDAPEAPPPSAGRFGGALRAVGRNLGWLVASRGIMAVLSLFYLGIATRALGVTGFGRVALVTGAAQTLATLVAFQSGQVVVQVGGAPAARGDDAALGRLFRGSLLLDIGSAALGSVLAAAILFIWSDTFGIGPTLQRAALIYAIVQVVTIRSTPLGILRLRDRFSHAALADSVTPLGRFVGAWLVLLIHPTVQGFLVVWAVTEVLTATTFWILAAKVGGWRLIRCGGGMRQLLAEHPGLLRFALSTNASSTLALASKQVPLLVVGAWLGPASAGVFRLAAQMAQALAKLSQLISRAAFPEVVKMVKAASAAQLGRMLSRLFMGSGLAAVAIMALVAVAGRPVLDLVGGHAFRDAWPVLLWLAIAGCLDLATVGVDTVLTALQRAGTVFGLRSIGVVVLFGAAALLMPVYGTVGVAMAVAAGSAGVALLMALAALRLARRGPPQ